MTNQHRIYIPTDEEIQEAFTKWRQVSPETVQQYLSKLNPQLPEKPQLQDHEGRISSILSNFKAKPHKIEDIIVDITTKGEELTEIKLGKEKLAVNFYHPVGDHTGEMLFSGSLRTAIWTFGFYLNRGIPSIEYIKNPAGIESINKKRYL
jgi:hypothetical protein